MKDLGKGMAIAGIWVAAAYVATHGGAADSLTYAAGATFVVCFFM